MNQPNVDKKTFQAFKAVTLGSVVFFSITGFPLTKEVFSSGLGGMITSFSSFFIIGIFYSMFFGKGKVVFVYLSSLVLTALGMLIRYLIDYGEVSNAQNFTMTNSLVYIGLVPLLISLIYLVAVQIFTTRA